MNQLQRWILVGGLVLVVAACLFPPWVEDWNIGPYGGAHGSASPASFVLAPPSSTARPDYARLGLEVAAIAGLAGVVFLLAARRRNPPASN